MKDIDLLVGIFGPAQEELKAIHKELRGILERDGVLGTEARNFSNDAVAKMAQSRANSLLAKMKIIDAALIRVACRGHPVKYCKLVMAIFRRGEAFHQFHAQGRMRLSEPA